MSICANLVWELHELRVYRSLAVERKEAVAICAECVRALRKVQVTILAIVTSRGPSTKLSLYIYRANCGGPKGGPRRAREYDRAQAFVLERK